MSLVPGYTVETHTGLRLSVRTMTEEDLPYVLSSALSDVRQDPSLREMTSQEFHRTVGADVRRSLDEAYDAIVLTPVDDDYLIIGCAWGDPRVPAIGYLQVRPSFRGQGVATSLASLLDCVPGRPTLVEFPTRDLTRPEANLRYPMGLFSNPRWSLRPSGVR